MAPSSLALNQTCKRYARQFGEINKKNIYPLLVLYKKKASKEADIYYTGQRYLLDSPPMLFRNKVIWVMKAAFEAPGYFVKFKKSHLKQQFHHFATCFFCIHLPW